MADNKQFKRREETDVAEDDPLAELTRIMGLQEAPADVAEVQSDPGASDESDAEIDLEKELMGGLSDEPARSQPLQAVQTNTTAPDRQPEIHPTVDDEEMERALTGEPDPAEASELTAETSNIQSVVDDAPKAPVLKPSEQDSFEQMVARARNFPAPEAVDPAADETLPRVVANPTSTSASQQFDTAPTQPVASSNKALPPVAGRNTLEDELKTILADIGDPPGTSNDIDDGDDEPTGDTGTYKPIFGRSNVQPLMPAAESQPVSAPEEEIDFGSGFEADLADAVAEAASQPVSVPEVETVEVPEQAQSVVDDLAIPELAPDPPAQVLTDHDDLEAEFSALFGDGDKPKISTRAEPIAAEPAKSMPNLEEPLEIDSIHLGSDVLDAVDDLEDDLLTDEDRIAAASAAVAATAAMPVAHQLKGGHVSTTEAALETLAARAQSDGRADRGSGRKGMMIAAVVVGIALLGGIGMFALSFGGGEDDALPAVVLAEPGDIKVKPDDPGGATVPNQDNKVYEKVSGESSVDSPAQEKLVTTTEEPVDVAARAVRTRIVDTVPVVEPDLQKSEERLAPSQAENPSLTNDDIVVVVPRRVKTMIVKPDGTMVPREEAAPAVAPEITAVSDPGSAATDNQTALVDDGRAVTNPDGTPFIVPTPRPDRGAAVSQDTTGPASGNDSQETASVSFTQPAEPAETTPKPAETAPAPTPVEPLRTAIEPEGNVAVAPAKPAAPATRAAGPWGIQIASQPTRQGAQSTYQDLARRYGSVIGGRGVNIVRADIPGKGVYYRVRVPAGSKSQATSLCRSYKAAGGSCYIAKQ